MAWSVINNPISLKVILDLVCIDHVTGKIKVEILPVKLTEKK